MGSYPIIVAGGIASIEDLVALAKLGVEAAITGMAIYSGTLDLMHAIETIDAMSVIGNQANSDPTRLDSKLNGNDTDAN